LFKKCTLRRISIKSVMDSDKWMRHFKADLLAEAIVQFTSLWAMLQDLHLSADKADKLVWNWTTTLRFSKIYTIHPSFSAVCVALRCSV
jgi:hypothetical protein